MKQLFIGTVSLCLISAGHAMANDSATDGDALIAQCRQEAMDAGSADVDTYISECLDTALQYEKDE